MNGPKRRPIELIRAPIERKAMMEMNIFDQKLGGAFGGPCAVAIIDMK